MSLLRSSFTRTVTGAQFRCLLATLFCLVVADGLITRSLVELNLARESNPLLKGVVQEPGFSYLKMAGASVVALVLWDMYRLRPRMASIATVAAMVAYTGIVYWNVAGYILASL